MSNSENENKKPEQSGDDNGDARRPLEDEQDIAQPLGRRTNGERDARSQVAAYEQLSRNEYSRQPYEQMQPVTPLSRKRRANFLVGILTGALLFLLLGGLVGWQIGKHNT